VASEKWSPLAVRRAAAFLISLLLIDPGALAAGVPPSRDEGPDDPPAPHSPRRTQPPAAPPPGGPFFGVQVNVDGFGNNILGDAANEPSIAIDPTATNRMVIGWRQFDSVNSNFRQAGWGYSHDGGRTWTFPGVIEPGVFRSDPVLDSDNDGNVYYYSLTVIGELFVCDMFKSTNAGVSWLPGVRARGGDKAWMVVDRSGGTSDGNIYSAWSPFFSCCLGFFTRSVDGGQSYMAAINLPTLLFWGTLAVGPEGEVYVGGVDSLFTGRIVKSSNVQHTDVLTIFEVATAVDLGGTVTNGGGPNPGGLLGQVWVATDHSGGPTHGNVYMLASVNPPGLDPLDVKFTRSTDGGLTWSAPVRVNDDSPLALAWQWFATMSVAPNGRIDVVWNDTRNSGLANVSELFYASSEDGGISWSPNVALSPAFDSHVGWPSQNKIGDYYDMTSDHLGANLAYAATFNGEQDVYYLRIGEYDCNGNGVADPQDIIAMTSADCNGNGIPDECEIAAGTLADVDGNGVPDVCQCALDINADGTIDRMDVADLLMCFGMPAVPGCEPEDVNGDGTVNVLDLIELLLVFGTSCP
jgi:hypothetical protein